MEYYVSNNGKYYLYADVDPKKDTAWMTIYSSDGSKLLSEIESAFTIGGHRAAVSDSGTLFAAAAYSRSGIVFRDSQGNLLAKNKDVKKIQGLAFSSDGNYLYAWNGDDTAHTYYISTNTFLTEKRIVADRIIPNLYENDIVFWKQDIALIGEKKIKSPTFAFLCAVGTPSGVCLSPVCENPIMYDYNGNLLWKTDIVKTPQGSSELDHILQLTYVEETIFARSYNDNILALDPHTGKSLGIVGQNAVLILENGKSYLDKDMKIHKIYI